MNIVEKNEGQKIDYSVSGNMITFRDELMLNLSKYERDYPVHLDICENTDNILVTGLSERYVAQIDIPARQYTVITTGEGESAITTKEAVPFDIGNVTLTLWALEGANING